MASLNHRRWIAIVAAVCGCGPTASETDGDTSSTTTTASTTTSGEQPTTGEAPTTGQELPPIDCAALATVFDAPLWSIELAEAPSRLGVLDDDAVLLRDGLVERVGGDLTIWSHAFAENEYFEALAIKPGGPIAVGGEIPDSGGALALIGGDGQRLATRTGSDEPELQGVVALAQHGNGDLFSLMLVGGQIRLGRFDAELAPVWTVEVAEHTFMPVLALDGDGNAYIARADIAAVDDNNYTWSLQVRSFSGDGEPRWTSEPVQFTGDNSLAEVEISVGDQVYALIDNAHGFALDALSLAGDPVWQQVRSFGDVGDHRLRAIAASPCGGVFVGGRSDVEIDSISERASLFHIAADGTFGPVTHLLDMSQDGEHVFQRTESLAIAPNGRIVAAGTLELILGEDSLAWLRAY